MHRANTYEAPYCECDFLAGDVDPSLIEARTRILIFPYSTAYSKKLSDDSFEMVISDELGQSIDQYEKAVLTTNFPAIRDALSQHLSQLSGKEVRKGLENTFTYKKMKCRCGSRSF